jgi:hypothetical protein
MSSMPEAGSIVDNVEKWGWREGVMWGRSSLPARVW